MYMHASSSRSVTSLRQTVSTVDCDSIRYVSPARQRRVARDRLQRTVNRRRLALRCERYRERRAHDGMIIPSFTPSATSCTIRDCCTLCGALRAATAQNALQWTRLATATLRDRSIEQPTQHIAQSDSSNANVIQPRQSVRHTARRMQPARMLPGSPPQRPSTTACCQPVGVLLRVVLLSCTAGSVPASRARSPRARCMRCTR